MSPALMNFVFLTAVVALIFPDVALSQTLCRNGEVDYFSCEAKGSRKIISVCGNIVGGQIDGDSWLQYRYGKKGAIELAYPTEKKDSVSKFEGNNFSKYSVIDLRFINGKTLYGVSLNGSYESGDGTELRATSGGVAVALAKSARTQVDCASIDQEKYFLTFGELNDAVRAKNGETDFLYRFNKGASK